MMYLFFTVLYLMTYFKLLFMVLNLQLNARAQGCIYTQLRDCGCKSFLNRYWWDLHVTGAPWDQTWHNAEFVYVFYGCHLNKVPVSLGYYFVNRSPKRFLG